MENKTAQTATPEVKTETSAPINQTISPTKPSYTDLQTKINQLQNKVSELETINKLVDNTPPDRKDIVSFILKNKDNPQKVKEYLVKVDLQNKIQNMQPNSQEQTQSVPLNEIISGGNSNMVPIKKVWTNEEATAYRFAEYEKFKNYFGYVHNTPSHLQKRVKFDLSDVVNDDSEILV